MSVLRVSKEGLKWNRKLEVLRGLLVKIVCYAFEQNPKLQEKQDIAGFFPLFMEPNPLEVIQTVLILKHFFLSTIPADLIFYL